jgi:hypothetical protein
MHTTGNMQHSRVSFVVAHALARLHKKPRFSIGAGRQQFDIHLPMATLFESPTIAELALMVEIALVEEIGQLDNVAL